MNSHRLGPLILTIGVGAMGTIVSWQDAAASSQDATATNPFVRAVGNEAAGVAGDWKGYRGLFPPYRPGTNLAVQFTIHNTTGKPVRLLSANAELPPRGALRLVGVRLALAPPPPTGDVIVSGLRAPYGRLPTPRPILVPAHGYAWIQFNFRQLPCLQGQPTRQIYNQHAQLHYRTTGHSATSTLSLRGDQITLTAPPCSH